MNCASIICLIIWKIRMRAIRAGIRDRYDKQVVAPGQGVTISSISMDILRELGVQSSIILRNRKCLSALMLDTQRNDVEVQCTLDSSNVLQEILQESPVRPDETKERRVLLNTPSSSVSRCSGRIPRPPDRYYKDVLIHP